MQKTQMKPVDDRLKQEGRKLRDELKRESETVRAEVYKLKRRTDETKTNAISHTSTKSVLEESGKATWKQPQYVQPARIEDGANHYWE